MNRWRSPVFAVAVLLGAALATPWPARSVAAESEPPVANQESGPQLADRLFRVEWTAGGSGRTEARIIGYVYNDSRQDAVNVQLRISELDASGRTVRSVIKPMGDPVPALGRASFDLEVAGSSASYQVAVESFGLMDDPWATRTTEQLLAAVGFQIKLADTPEKLANLRTLTPRRTLIPQAQDDRVYYIYADPDLCECLYVGPSAQYQRALQKSLETDQLIAIQQQPIVWGLWGTWPGF
jgi:hypothetical protein